MDKRTTIRSKKVARVRGWIQAAATLLTNIHIPNLFKGKIYQGNAKTVCVPGLNCYSCPAAAGACPIGAFQAVVGSSNFKFSYYITGFFILLGVTLGRFICGFLCPFGWFQDLLHKIPGKKFSTARLKPLRYLKYIILIVFVIALPMLVTNSIGMGDPFFCKYICPQGVLEGAIPLSLGNSAIRSALGRLFSFNDDTPGTAFKVFSLMAKHNVNVDIILQSVGRDNKKSISFTIREDDAERVGQILRDAKEMLGYEDVSINTKVAKVSIVGAGMASATGVASRMFEALASVGINIRMISTSEIKISVLINKEDSEKAVKAIHEEFFNA